MKIYNYNSDTLILTTASIADESPLEPGVFLIPAFATDIKPPEFDSSVQTCRFVDGAWEVKAIPEPMSIYVHDVLPINDKSRLSIKD